MDGLAETTCQETAGTEASAGPALMGRVHGKHLPMKEGATPAHLRDPCLEDGQGAPSNGGSHCACEGALCPLLPARAGQQQHLAKQLAAAFFARANVGRVGWRYFLMKEGFLHWEVPPAPS